MDIKKFSIIHLCLCGRCFLFSLSKWSKRNELFQLYSHNYHVVTDNVYELTYAEGGGENLKMITQTIYVFRLDMVVKNLVR